MNEFNNYTKHLFLVLLLSFFTSFVSNLYAEVVVVESVHTQSPLYRFVDYLENVTTALEQAGNVSEEKIAYMRTHVSLTKQWVDRVSTTVIQGAFTNSPLIIQKLYSVFDEIDPTQWPTLSLTRKWVAAMNEYKEFLRAAYLPALSSSLNRQLDSDSVNAIMGLHSELTRSVFTKDFFDFSILETALDTFFIRPVEFTKAHPYLVGGTILTIAAVGGAWYWYSTKEQRAWKQWMKDENALFVQSHQSGAECSIWSMYRQWSLQEADGDEERYAQIANDMATYERFKELVIDIRQDQRARQGLRPVNRAALVNWLEADDVVGILDNLRQRAAAGQEFGLREDDLPFTGSFEMINDDLRNVAHDVVIGVDLDGVPLMGRPHQERIREFNLRAGNKYDFIVNTNPIPNFHGRRRGVPARGHFFHVRAINDPAIEDGIRFIVSESRAHPDREYISARLNDIRSMLRPYEEAEA